MPIPLPIATVDAGALDPAQLAALGVKVASTGNRWPLDPVTVRTALARRATADLDDDSP